MDNRLLPLYFVIGGAVVAATTYFGSRGQGLFAAFIGAFPSVTVITILSIYFSSGANATISYAKGMLILLPSWFLYVLTFILLMPRIGLAGSVIAGMAVYLILALVTMRFVR